MIFNSYTFVFAFLPDVLSLFILLRRNNDTQLITALLVIASLVYCAWWKFDYIYLLLLSILVNYFIRQKVINGTKIGVGSGK